MFPVNRLVTFASTVVGQLGITQWPIAGLLQSDLLHSYIHRHLLSSDGDFLGVTQSLCIVAKKF